MAAKLEERYARLRMRLKIDELNIDQEIMEQPMLVQEAAELANELREESGALKHAFDIIKAEVSGALRANGEKMTEGALGAAVLLDKSVQDARTESEQAELGAARAAALVSAFHDKTRMLAKTADLIVSGFITPASTYEKDRVAIRRRQPSDAR